MFDLLDKAMWSYIIKDIGKELEYLPYALFLGIIVYFVFKIILRKNSKPLYNFYKVIFLVYLFALVHITLFEREPGSRTAISRVCQVFCVSFKKIFWGGEPPHLYHPTLLNDTLLKYFGNISNRVSCQ